MVTTVDGGYLQIDRVYVVIDRPIMQGDWLGDSQMRVLSDLQIFSGTSSDDRSGERCLPTF